MKLIFNIKKDNIMYTIIPSVTDITQTDFTMDGVLRHIERCARVCYKSESKMSDTADGSRAFVCRLIERGHLRPLEFGTVYLCSHMDIWPHNRLNMPPWLQYAEIGGVLYAVQTNLRYLIERQVAKMESSATDGNDLLHAVESYLRPELADYFTDNSRHTFAITAQRAIVDELRTHISLSHLAESTRYCAYADGIGVVQGSWSAEQDDSVLDAMMEALTACDKAYRTMLEAGVDPQNAREVLPLCVKSELVSCGTREAWRHLVELRESKSAHPEACFIASEVKKALIKRAPATSVVSKS